MQLTDLKSDAFVHMAVIAGGCFAVFFLLWFVKYEIQPRKTWTEDEKENDGGGGEGRRQWEKLLYTASCAGLQLAGHCLRQPNKIASKPTLWQLSVGRVSRGREPIDSYIDDIKRDTSLDSISEIRSALLDSNLWKDFVMIGLSKFWIASDTFPVLCLYL